MLNDEKFCDLFYQEYRAETDETRDFYTKYQFAVASTALLGGVLAAVTRRDLLAAYWLRVDVFLYYTAAGIAGACLAAATACLILSIRPRNYKRLDDLENWRKWRSDYRQDVADAGYGGEDQALVDAAVASATCEHVTQRLGQAADWNTGRNRVKTRWFNYYLYWTVLAIVAVAAQCAMHAVLFFTQGKTP